jgi:hypothetical protein
MKTMALGSLLIAASLCSMAGACPLCRDSSPIESGTTSGGGGSPPVALFNASILCILFGFLAIVAFLIVKIVTAIRVANRQHSI